jgi:inorganic pyrophosphatase
VSLPAKMHTMTRQGHGWDACPKNEHFFQVYKDLEGHVVFTDGFDDRASALHVIEQARRRARG